MEKYHRTMFISECGWRCPFFFMNDEDIKCNHPCFDNNKDKHFLNWDDASIGKIPTECPLKIDSCKNSITVILRK